MRTAALPRTGLELSVIGLGSWAFGAGRGGSSGLGPQADAESVATIHRALELGINWIDTAASYGRGHAELVIARALRGLAERPFVFTKCGTVFGPASQEAHCLTPDSVRAEIDASLRRLEVDVLDLVYVHWPLPEAEVGDGWATLATLQREGKIRHLGASNFAAGILADVAAIAPIAAVQSPYSLLDREIESEVLPYCADHRIGVLAYSTLKHGLLSGAFSARRAADLPASDWRRGHPEFTEPRLSRNLDVAATVRRIARRHGTSNAVIATGWTLEGQGIAGAIVGARRPAHIEELAKVGQLRLTAADIAELDAADARALAEETT